MYGYSDLKQTLLTTKTTVECPVRGCSTVVERQRKTFRRSPEFRCGSHDIWISPSTFEYRAEQDNLLWIEGEDLELLERIQGDKRESRMARDNSEDALSWNVFRFLERNDILDQGMGALADTRLSDCKAVYWSYSRTDGGPLPLLQEARRAFGERPGRGSEPDLILIDDKNLIFIEAKLTASNNTSPSRLEACPTYEAAEHGWASRVFTESFSVVADQHRKYELARFWLLGTWMAQQSGRVFRLVSLVPRKRERAIVERFGPLVEQSADARFLRLTWEEIATRISNSTAGGAGANRLLDYLENKTTGYGSDSRLTRAFVL